MRHDLIQPIQEAESLLNRVRQMVPLETRMPMVQAASISPGARRAIFEHVTMMKQQLASRLTQFISWVKNGDGGSLPLQTLQQKLTAIKLSFVSALFGYDIFCDVLTQRSEHETGIWLAGLDAVAEDALRLPENIETPPVVCYLERGLGAAIRRAGTSLPGRHTNPVAVIRVPRERMVGFGISASLVHEVGHQAEMLLGLSFELRQVVERAASEMSGGPGMAWRTYASWITEILADSWGVSLLGIIAPRGLMSVLSLPRPFLFRMKPRDPHPMPWIRVKLCLKIGNALYPHLQWQRLERTWERMYPIPQNLPVAPEKFYNLVNELNRFISFLLSCRPRSLAGASLGTLLRKPERQPMLLRQLFEHCQQNPEDINKMHPTHTLAMMGQGLMDGRLDAAADSRAMSQLLRQLAINKNTGEKIESPTTDQTAVRSYMTATAQE